MTHAQIEAEIAGYETALATVVADLIDARRKADALPLVVHAVKDMIHSLRAQLVIIQGVTK